MGWFSTAKPAVKAPAVRKLVKAAPKPATRASKAHPVTVVPKGAKPNDEGLFYYKGDRPPIGAAMIVWGVVGESEWYWKPETAVADPPMHHLDDYSNKSTWSWKPPFPVETAWISAGIDQMHRDGMSLEQIEKEAGYPEWLIKRVIYTKIKFRQVGEQTKEKWEKRAVRDIAPAGWSEWDYPDHCAWKNVYFSPEEFSKRTNLIYDTDPDRRYIVHWKDGGWMYRLTNVVRNGPNAGMISGSRVWAPR